MGIPIILGCNNDTIGATGDGGYDTDFDAASGDTDVDADTDIDTDTDVDTDVDIDTDTDTDVDSDVDTDTVTDTGTDTDTGPTAPAIGLHSDDLCAYPASIAHDAVGNRLYITCGSFSEPAQNALWKSAELDTSGDWAQVAQVGGYPSHHIMTNGYAIVGHTTPHGFTIVDIANEEAGQIVDFADLDLGLGYSPTFPAGMIVLGGKLLIATSNLNTATMEYDPGTVISFDYADGAADTASAQAYTTSGLNATALVKISDDSFAVLSSGNYDPETSQASIELCEFPSMSCTATGIGDVTAQSSAIMPITDGGLILVGIQLPENRLMGIDSVSGDIIVDREMPDVENFIANICAYGDVAVMSDFGQIGLGSRILYAHTADDGWPGVPTTPMAIGSCGPAVMAEDTLYQTVTDNDGMSGSVWEADLSGLY